MINVCVPTLNRYDLLLKLTQSLERGSVQPKELVIIDNGCNKEILEFTSKCRWLSFGKNIGVAASWNWFLKNIEFPLLICNDDLEFGINDLAQFEDAYVSNAADLYWASSIDGMNVFSCFMPTSHLVETVGYFDENFYPAYFEDNDYFYRMKLEGLSTLGLNTTITHFGSATVKKYTGKQNKQHHKNFEKNKAYYIRKWGGMPRKEIYTEPFNGRL